MPIRERIRNRGHADAAAFDLAALDREIELLRAAIAADELDVELEYIARNENQIGVAAAGCKAAEPKRKASRLEIGDRFDGRVRTHHDAVGIVLIARRRADPEKLLAFVL